ncbi:MAG: hypothetical protein ABSF44_08865 [Candidatus Bathyarchaeia archaeon]|jgi:glycine cleavage system H protein
MSETFGFEFRPELYYSKDHVWVKIEADGNARVGFDDIVAKGAHEIFFIKVSPVGSKAQQNGGKLGIIESRKYTGPIVTPLTCEIIEVNEIVRRTGAAGFQHHPYDDGWLCIIKPSNLEAEMKNLMHGDVALSWFKKEAEPLADEAQYFKDMHKEYKE